MASDDTYLIPAGLSGGPAAPSAARPRGPVVGTGGTKVAPALIALAAGLVPCVLAYAMATMNESRVLAVVLALVGVVVIIARPYWGLILFVGLLYTRPEESIPAIQGMRLPLLISVLTLVALIFQNLLDRRPAVRTPLNGTVLGFGAAVVLSTMSAGNTATALQDIAKLVILVFLVINLVSTPARYRGFVTALLAFTTYLSVYSTYLFYTGAIVIQDGAERAKGATGIFSDPNDTAATLVAGFALALLRLRQAKGPARISYACVTGIMLWAILLTNSRGGMLALLAVLGTFLFSISRRKVLAAVSAGVIGMAFLALGPSRMTSFDSTESSANSRFWFWVNGVEQLIHRPFLGVGYGGFPDVNGGMTAHNSFVLCFAETGILGYVFWIGCIYYCFRRVAGVTAPPPADSVAALDPATADSSLGDGRGGGDADLLGARLALAGFLVAGFFISRTYVPVLYLLLSLPVARLVCIHGPRCGYAVPQSERLRDCWRIGALALVSIALIYVFALRMR